MWRGDLLRADVAHIQQNQGDSFNTNFPKSIEVYPVINFSAKMVEIRSKTVECA
jgi:hypothetical protein